MSSAFDDEDDVDGFPMVEFSPRGVLSSANAAQNTLVERWKRLSTRTRFTIFASIVAAFAIVVVAFCLALFFPLTLGAGGGGGGGGGGDDGAGSSSTGHGGYDGDPCVLVVGRSNSLEPRPVLQTTDVVLTNVDVWDGTLHRDDPNSGGMVRTGVDILLRRGKVHRIGPDLDVPSGTSTIDLAGFVVTPGMVDMHSHAGVYSFPDVKATSDGNEVTNPLTPMVRALDAFDPEDLALPQIRKGGVTTLQVLPGSGNLMGGEAFHVKILGATTSDMRIHGSPRALKMACGENPKRVYGNRKHMPMSRMGSAWLMRQRFHAAKQLMVQQDDWCAAPADAKPHTYFPQDLSLDPLVDLLRGKINLNVHCYQTHDLEMMLRLASEFGFSVQAFHHALEAYKVPDMMLDGNVTIATFSDLWGYKMEAYDASVHSPASLYQAGIPLVLKTDHPVTFAQDLMMEAAKAHHYGLPADASIHAVTLGPARSIGLSSMVGSIEPGKDADLVVWDRHPLRLGASPRLVFIDGVLAEDLRMGMPDGAGPNTPPQVTRPPADLCTPMLMEDEYARTISSSQGTTEALVVQNVHVYTGESTVEIEDATVVVESGIITCLGDCPSSSFPPGATLYDMQGRGASLLPSFIETSAYIGMSEVGAESSTHDGTADAGPMESQYVRAIDGIRMGSRHVRSARVSGVSSSVVFPSSTNPVQGISAGVRLAGAVPDEWMAQHETALHVVIGQDAKGDGMSGSIAAQVHMLRSALSHAQEEDAAPYSPFARVVRGELVLAVHAHTAEVITSVLRLTSAFPSVQWVVVGGAEAHLVAQRLARAHIPVILSPARCTPFQFFQWKHCVPDGAKRLIDAGVNVSLSTGDADNARNLPWEAGLLVERWGVSLVDALATITSNVASAFHLSPSGVGVVRNGTTAAFTVVSGTPLRFGSYVELAVVGNHVDCQPQQR